MTLRIRNKRRSNIDRVLFYMSIVTLALATLSVVIYLRIFEFRIIFSGLTLTADNIAYKIVEALLTFTMGFVIYGLILLLVLNYETT